MNSQLTPLEYSVIEKCCAQQGTSCPSREAFVVVARDRTPVGFMTEIEPSDTARQVPNGGKRIYDSIPAARAVRGGEIMGFLLFFNDGALDAIEGFIYNEEAWPAREWPVQYESAKHAGDFDGGSVINT